MHLSDLCDVIIRRWRMLLVVLLVCLAAAGGYAATVPTTYTASTRIYVSMATGTSVADSYKGGLAAQQRIASYSYIAGGATVAQRVIDDVGLAMTPSELQSKIKVTFPPATSLLDIAVTDPSPDRASMLADKVAAQFRRLVGQMETTVVGAAPAAQATVIEYAQTPTKPNSPNLVRLLAIGLLGGLVLGLLAAFARDRFDSTLRTSEQVAKTVAVPVLASVPLSEPAATQAVAQLRAYLTSARSGSNVASLLLTSFSTHSLPAVAVRLSKALADSNRRVALVDTDITLNGASALLGMLGDTGVAEWLRTQETSVDELVHLSDGVAVVPIGAADARTSDLLSSDRLVELVSQLKERFDFVLVDTAPASIDAAAVSLSSRLDATLAVVELGTTSQPQLRAAVEAIGGPSSGLIGAVVTSEPRAERRRRDLAVGKPEAPSDAPILAATPDLPADDGVSANGSRPSSDLGPSSPQVDGVEDAVTVETPATGSPASLRPSPRPQVDRVEEAVAVETPAAGSPASRRPSPRPRVDRVEEAVAVETPAAGSPASRRPSPRPRVDRVEEAVTVGAPTSSDLRPSSRAEVDQAEDVAASSRV
jgi:receptor protein-tyrosine kinase